MNNYTVLVGHYDYRLVALSIFIAVLAAYAALDLAGRVSIARGMFRHIWLYGGALAMGTGIWAMHYIGMEALRLPIPVLYDWPTVLLSLLAAIAASHISLFIVSRPTINTLRTIFGSICMGSGIAAMHYIGMAAMRLYAVSRYSTQLVALSILLAIIISFAALRISFTFRNNPAPSILRKCGCALILGLAIPTMHYVGMAAVTFYSSATVSGSLTHALNVSAFRLASIVLITLTFLVTVFLTSMIDRRFARQEHELKENRLQLRTIFDNMADAIIVLDRDRRIVQMNKPARQLLPFGQEEIGQVASRSFELHSAEGVLLSHEEWPASLALRGEFMHNREMLIRRIDTGTVIVAEISTTPIHNQAGKVAQVIVTYHDITERKKSTEERARLAAIVDSSEDAIIGKDENGVVRSWNAAAERIFGYTADEIIGKSILTLVPKDHELEEKSFLNSIRSGHTIEHIETIRRRKDGKLIDVALTISPIKDPHGKVVGASKMARDISDRKQLERQLQQSQKMEAIGQLTGGIAHDFNNLLSIIICNLELLQEKLLPATEDRELSDMALDASLRGADLIKQLLAFSRKQNLDPQKIDVNDLVQSMTNLLARSIGEQVDVLLEMEPDVWPAIADPVQLQTALVNLATNARDAMRGGGKLVIQTANATLDDSYAQQFPECKAGEYIMISVSDTGTGMDPETIERAFDPFFTTKPVGEGTGLGLSMVFGFVKQSGGHVRLYSEVGQGTTIHLYLPRAGAQHSRPSTGKLIRKKRVTHAAKILLVEDNKDLAKSAYRVLTDAGFIVTPASNTAEALGILRNDATFDVLFTDIILTAGSNGIELAQETVKLYPAIKILFASGFSETALRASGKAIVADRFIAKPYRKDELIARINSLIDTGN